MIILDKYLFETLQTTFNSGLFRIYLNGKPDTPEQLTADIKKLQLVLATILSILN